METSQVQNDLKQKFFVVLIMLGVLFVSDAFCHDPDPPTPHTYAECLDDLVSQIIGCAFANSVLPPDESNQAEQTPQQTPRQLVDPFGAGTPLQPQTPQQQPPGSGQTPQQTPRQLVDPSGTGTPLQPQTPQQQPPGPQPQQTSLQSGPSGQSGLPPQQQQPVSTPAYTPKVQAASETQAKPMLPVKVTEYMLRDRIRYAGGGLPQWIEVYNPNTEPVNLKGYQFTYAHRKFVNHPWVYETQSIPHFMIPAQGAVIIANKPVPANTWRDVIAGIPNEQVWVIPNDNRSIQLKNGWHLADPNGEVVHRIGHAFREYPSTDPSDWDSTLERPHLPVHTEAGYRVSYQWPASVAPAEVHFYGNATDVGSPGFYEPAVPKAPSLVIRRKAGTWAELKSK